MGLSDPKLYLRRDAAQGHILYWAETAIKGSRKTLAGYICVFALALLHVSVYTDTTAYAHMIYICIILDISFSLPWLPELTSVV